MMMESEEITEPNINFNASAEDAQLIDQIVDRARKILPNLDRMDLTMDITAVHLNGCKLRLQDLLDADKFNFVHDVAGIVRHIDRESGRLMDCFSPRFSQ